ncbi:hypothetical protein CPB83DRAFT_854306 [Crepidotus variabilis]|uniref:YCII-related domain-containing protein n=1 Tax=Crepidotus variabilis TaxID=179855 RepID=A0A9P6EGM0_9AGAR|nr:hypothetical protein CPB83DRAFT_854306 [Crepidotus variabilis]
MFRRFVTPSRSLLRTMSSAPVSAAPPARKLFFVWAPDKTEEGTFQKRLSVREKHLVTAKERIEGGFIRLGGMVTTPESIATPDTPKKMIGSTFICEAESLDEVRKKVENDIYYTSGVWDPEKLVILPFFGATTIP